MEHDTIFSFFETGISSGISYSCSQKLGVCDPIISAAFTASIMTVTLIANKIFNACYGKVGEDGHKYGLCETYNTNIHNKKYGLENRCFNLMVPVAVSVAGISLKWFTLKESMIAFSVHFLTRKTFLILKKGVKDWVSQQSRAYIPAFIRPLIVKRKK